VSRFVLALEHPEFRTMWLGVTAAQAAAWAVGYCRSCAALACHNPGSPCAATPPESRRDAVLFIDKSTVQQVLSMEECINIQEQAFLGLPSGASTAPTL